MTARLTSDPDPGLYGRSFADVYDDWYGDLNNPDDVVGAFRARLTPRACIVEFGSGTGRLATPLAAAGFTVIGIDASIEMLRMAPVTPHLSSVGADMASVPLATASADAVLIAYNTLFNVVEPQRQQRCLAEACRLLKPDGLLVLECFIATAFDAEPAVSAAMRSVDTDHAVVIVTARERATGRSQLIVGSHIEVRTNRVVCRPWELLYRPPGELDASARDTGLVLRERFADWTEQRFDPLGSRHVSWYQPAR